MNPHTETELSSSLIASIQQCHEIAEANQKNAVDGLSALIIARRETAALVEKAKAETGKGFREWWDNSGLPYGWAARYLTIARTAKRNALGDKNQLRLIGILPEIETGNKSEQQSKQVNPFAWVKAASRLAGSLPTDRISNMDDFEKREARERLKPIVDCYKALGGE